jgi:hypothetical protein
MKVILKLEDTSYTTVTKAKDSIQSITTDVYLSNVKECLVSSKINSFTIDDIVDLDNVIGLNFTLTTDLGKFEAKNIEYVDGTRFVELSKAFRPEFGEKLRELLLDYINIYEEFGDEPEINYTPN